METMQVILFVGGSLLLAAIGLCWCYAQQISRARALLEAWAQRYGYRITHADFRLANRGPYFFSSNAHFVFYLAVEDDEGRTRQGWLRGNYWSSASETIDVTWE